MKRSKLSSPASRLYATAFFLAAYLIIHLPLSAEQFGLFSYQVRGDSVEITNYPWDAVGEVQIPAEIEGLPVAKIGDRAFDHCRTLTSITIPVGATCIGRRAFRNCAGLTSVTIPESITSIGYGAFSGCTSLHSVTVPASVTSIGGSAFSGCTVLTSVTIPDGVMSIGSRAFRECNSLTSVAIPASVTSIGHGAFYGCAGLTSFEVDALNSRHSSLDGVLFDKEMTTLLHYPAGNPAKSYAIPGGATSIGDMAFGGCAGLTSVTISEGVSSIGDYAFWDCTGLTSVTISEGVSSIGGYAFWDCTGLTSVTIPESVTEIGDGAFSGCTDLPSVTIPEGLTSIGDGAFVGCAGLSSVTIPEGITSIGDWAFGGCTGLSSVSIPDSVTSIGLGAFGGCAGLTSVTIPEGVINIGEIINYDDCNGVPAGAFSGCAGLTSVTIPGSVTSIGEATFDGCTNLVSIQVQRGNTSYASVDGVLYSADLKKLIRCPEGKAGDFVIPNGVEFIHTVGGQGRDRWDDCYFLHSAFGGCKRLSSISIPESVRSLWPLTFTGCENLEAILVAERNQNFASRSGVLYNGQLTDLIFCPVKKNGTVTIPASLEFGSIEYDRVFENCTGIDAFEVEDGSQIYRSIDGVLVSKDGNRLVQFPAGRSGSYRIPESVSTIDGWDSDFGGEFGHSPFANCNQLTSVVIPESVHSIGWRSFSGCQNLVAAIFEGDATFEDYENFTEVSPEFTIYFREGSSGFTSPMWGGHPTIMLGENSFPRASWLVQHTLPLDTHLDQDTNGDGVSLLMAYALDLDPNLNLQSSLTAPVLDGDTLSMTFHAASPGITYTVETSTDLKSWTTDGVTLSDLDAENQRTASVNRDSPKRFLRLVVSETP